MEIYKGVSKINKYEYDNIIEKGILDLVYKRHIVDFLMSLEFEKIKELVNFKEIDPFKLTPKSSDEADYLSRLRFENNIEVKMEIKI